MNKISFIVDIIISSNVILCNGHKSQLHRANRFLASTIMWKAGRIINIRLEEEGDRRDEEILSVEFLSLVSLLVNKLL